MKPQTLLALMPPEEEIQEYVDGKNAIFRFMPLNFKPEELREIMRALAIAQAVDDARKLPMRTEFDAIGAGMVSSIEKRADEILAALKEGK